MCAAALGLLDKALLATVPAGCQYQAKADGADICCCVLCSKAFLFLLSARACGLGIHLPSISAITILDSDWNAKADVQALSRAHLLGPPVGAGAPLRLLRLYMRNSVEEKILTLAERKGGVAAAFRPGSAGGYAPILALVVRCNLCCAHSPLLIHRSKCPLTAKL